MPIPRFVTKVNKVLTNRVMILLTRWPPFTALRHTGRVSGREYRIPINVFPAGEGFIFALTYGPDTDWVKNVLATGSATLEYSGTEIPLKHPRFIGRAEAEPLLPAVAKRAYRILGVDEFLLMDQVEPDNERL